MTDKQTNTPEENIVDDQQEFEKKVEQEVEQEGIDEEQVASSEPELTPEQKLLVKIEDLSKSVPLSAEDYVNLDAVDVLEQLRDSVKQAQQQGLVNDEFLAQIWSNLRPFLESLRQENFTYLRDPDYSTKIHNTLNYHKSEVESAKSALHRAKRDALKSASFANEKIVKTIIKPLIQNLVTAREHLPKNTGNAQFDEFTASLETFDNDFRKSLAEHNIVVFGSVGDDFDPLAHEAISAVHTDNFDLHMKVAVVTAEGYKLNDRVVLPAQVIINMFAG